MRKLIFLLGLAVAVAFGGGCAGKINSNKIPPSEYDVQETKMVWRENGNNPIIDR